jgi:phosphoglycerate dehydrogenase-like enzyme
VRICVLDDLEAAALSAADWTPVTTRGELTVVNRHVDDEDELVELLQPFDVVVAMRERTAFRRSLLARLPALRLLVTTGARNAAIDLATCAERGVVVSGTTGGGSPVVELAWALILATVRDLPSRVGSMAAGEWPPASGSRRWAPSSRAAPSGWSGSGTPARGWRGSDPPSAWRCSPGAPT